MQKRTFQKNRKVRVNRSFSRHNLIEEQSNDKELLDLFKIALTPVERKQKSVGYLIKDNILMRQWSPTECDNSEKGKTVYQIVLPTVHRREVLELAHGLPMFSHLGVGKTQNRVLQHFFWPGLKRDVAKWCKECHACQLGGKPNQNIPQAPLHPIFMAHAFQQVMNQLGIKQ